MAHGGVIAAWWNRLCTIKHETLSVLWFVHGGLLLIMAASGLLVDYTINQLNQFDPTLAQQYKNLGMEAVPPLAP